MKLDRTVCFLSLFFFLANGTPISKHYIVYMGEHSHPDSDAVIADNYAFLSSITGSAEKAKETTIHHYSKSFRGFSALLTPEQAQHLSATDGVVSVFESKTNYVHTTRSWEFLGLGSSETQLQGTFGNLSDDVIIGSIDTGVWPESESFNDDGLGPVPKRFKGRCVTGENFTLANCNRKIIGARFYYKGFEAESGPLDSVGQTYFRSARDADGHGTHTASTAAGNYVSNASLLGMGSGTARGGATRARLAIYKACWFDMCSDADILAAFDDATADGVDVISISAGSTPDASFFTDAIAIGAFHAFRKGIVTSASAGNSGRPSTAINVAPWIITVAASSIDRQFDSSIVLLNNSKIIQGRSLNPLKLKGHYGIIPGSLAASFGVSPRNASLCQNHTLDRKLVEGKIVICTLASFKESRANKSMVVKEAGGVGMILVDPIGIDVGFQYVIPATAIDQDQAQELQAYLASNNRILQHPD